MIDHYDWAGGREAMLRFGPETGPVVVAALPLFEEANRMRAFVVTMLRALAERGIASVLPDLPGTGESLVPTQEATLAAWRSAFAACCASVGADVHVAAMRGGAILDADATVTSRWYLVPVGGAAVARDLLRARLAAGLPRPGPDEAVIEVAGNLVSRELLDALPGAEPSDVMPRRVIREENDTRPANARFDIPMMWRLPEPTAFPSHARDLAGDLSQWVRACAR